MEYALIESGGFRTPSERSCHGIQEVQMAKHKGRGLDPTY